MNSFSDYLDNLEHFGIKLGLEQTRELMQRIGSPDRKLGFIHIAGSNGKGSTGAMLLAALRHAGVRTGFYTSPHLIDFCERIRIDGRAVAHKVLLEAFERLKLAADAMKSEGKNVTYFEFTTCLAALIFAEAQVELVIWETGMGGRYDSTNVVDKMAAIITNIALDHQQYLGDTPGKIAFEKAGIIASGVPVFVGETDPVPLAVLREQARIVGAPFFRSDEVQNALSDCRYEDGMQHFVYQGMEIGLSLPGVMQRRNFLPVAACLNYLSDRVGFLYQKALEGLSETRWPGRCQLVTPKLIIDGGHNPHGVAALAETLLECFPDRKFQVIFGSFRDKDTEKCLEILDKTVQSFIFTPLRYAFRASRSPEELRDMLYGITTCRDREVLLAGDSREAMALARDFDGLTVVCGSLYLAGEVLEDLGLTDQVCNI